MRRFIFSAVSLFCFLLTIAPSAFSQATSGTILGRVTDSSGAVVIGAQVVATNDATGVSQATLTEDLAISCAFAAGNLYSDGYEGRFQKSFARFRPAPHRPIAQRRFPVGCGQQD